MMRLLLISFIGGVILISGCDDPDKASADGRPDVEGSFSEEVKLQAVRCWNSYKQFAWGFDVLLPFSKKGHNWYEESLGISPFDAYSTLAVMGLEEDCQEVEHYALSKDWDQDVFVQVFEVNIRILGGLLAMYDHTQDPEILAKAIDFGDRILPAFNTPTGIPYHSVNLRTGETSGDRGDGRGNVINVAQAATYMVEFGILSYYAKDPKYYQAAKRASMAIFNRRSDIGLPGDYINIETGEWTNDWSHLQAGVDSYYEYLFKSNELFPDPEVQEMWNESLTAIQEYLADDHNDQQYYACVNMHSGEVVQRTVSLYDAFFPAVLALHGDIENADTNMSTWDRLWDKHGLLPTQYYYDRDSVRYGNSELNPEIIESAYYMHQLTGEEKYMDMIRKYWIDINDCCRNDLAYHAVKDVRTMEPKDYLATYFFAETLKYFYLAGVDKSVFNFDEYVFNTEAHPFKRSHFKQENLKEYLGIGAE